MAGDLAMERQQDFIDRGHVGFFSPWRGGAISTTITIWTLSLSNRDRTSWKSAWFPRDRVRAMPWSLVGLELTIT